jgi:hypothetical protein
MSILFTARNRARRIDREVLTGIEWPSTERGSELTNPARNFLVPSLPFFQLAAESASTFPHAMEIPLVPVSIPENRQKRS